MVISGKQSLEFHHDSGNCNLCHHLFAIYHGIKTTSLLAVTCQFNSWIWARKCTPISPGSDL